MENKEIIQKLEKIYSSIHRDGGDLDHSIHAKPILGLIDELKKEHSIEQKGTGILCYKCKKKLFFLANTSFTTADVKFCKKCGGDYHLYKET